MSNIIFFPKNNDENKVIVSAEVNKLITTKYAPERRENAGYYTENRGGYRQTLFDCWYYKCAEFAAAQYLHEKHNLPFIEPDTEIYKSSKKTWNADLSYKNVDFLDKHFDELKFHNKSASKRTIGKGYPESFMFQYANKNGKGGRDKIFDQGNENDYCIFVYVPYDGIVEGKVDFYIRGVIPWNFIKENDLLGNPKKKEFIDVKKCVYSEHIRKKLENLNVLVLS